ncbi:MAG: DegV family protein [Chloroflexota bacterium]|nr:DegV family protein [Chloroflexota bacterium]
MPKVSIVTDSCVSLSDEMLDKLDIHWVPYYIHRGKEVLRDLITIKREDFYKWLPTAKKLPKTANPGPGDYIEMYTKLAKEGTKEIISIHITSKGSGAYQAAVAAKNIVLKKIPDLKIEVIDTLNVSLCQGWMVIEAARDALTDKPFEAIVDNVRAMIPITEMLQTADTLKYLEMGGRIGKAKRLIGSLLNIKPLISMKDGVIVAVGQTRTRRRVYEMMIDKVEDTVGYMRKIKIAYVHAAAREEAEKLKGMAEERLNCVESLIAELSPVLGVHTGPGTVGLCYFPITDRFR